MMSCKIEGCGRLVENEDTGLCASHSRLARKTSGPIKKQQRIKPISAKKMLEINKYSKVKKEFLTDHQICPVCGKPGADSIHHSKGKIGYADEAARLEGVTLLLDTRFFVPIHSSNYIQEFGCSCHTYIEAHPEFAKKMGFSSTRLGKFGQGH